MDGNTEFLNYIHQNAEMGIETIKQLIGITTDPGFRTTLESQYREYKEIFDNAEHKMNSIQNEPKDIGAFSKISAHVMIDMKTLSDKSPSHISEMLIQGSTMGIIDMTKRIKEYSGADGDVVNLAHRLLQTEQRNVEECKKYLQ